MQDVQINLPIGSTLQDRYIVEELLGKGGFGAVYLVRDLRVKGNLFALKEVVDTDKKERERFRFECEVLRRLDHRALPRVYRTFEDDKRNRAYMLMDYINGSDLEVLRQLSPQKRFPFAQVMSIMAPIVDAVSYLHQQHPPIIHRDIKPANIICPDDGEEAVLVDLGIAKEYDMDATTTAIRRCSPGYGAPEQYERGTNPRTDIYGLGATFYALLSGEVPADAFHRMTQLGGKNTDPLVPVHQLALDTPQYVSDVIQRAMAINSKDRFLSVEEFWQALHTQPVDAVPIPVGRLPVPAASAANDELTTAPTVIIHRASNDYRRNRKAALALLFAALALFALLAGMVFGNNVLSMAYPTNHPAVTATSRSVPKTTITAVSTAQPGAAPTVPAVLPTPTSVVSTVPAATPTRSSSPVVPTATPTRLPTPQSTIHPAPTTQPTTSSTPEKNG